MLTLKNKTPADILAFMFSAIFSPYITAFVFIIIIIYNSSKDLGQFLPWMVTFLLFAIILPGLYFLWQIEIGNIRDLHLSDRNERKIPFMITAGLAIVGTIILVFMGAARPVVVMAVTYSINALAVALITQFWKISIHMTVFSSVATVTIILYGASYWWLYLILIPLAWARIHRKRHTIWQATAGAMLAFIITTAVFWAFGYL